MDYFFDINRFISFIFAYLIGSIPTAVWYSKIFHGFDIRDRGSGNAGATNVFRTLGPTAGSIVFAIDVLKGVAAALLYIPFGDSLSVLGLETKTLYVIYLGIFCVIGHVYPIFANFRGGKGVATMLGFAMMLQPLIALTCLVVFVGVFYATRYVSMGSMVAAVTFPIASMTGLYPDTGSTHTFFGLAVAVFIVYTHRKNIVRLMNGTENKM